MILEIPALAAHPGLVHGFSTIGLGSMQGTGGEALTPARRRFAERLGLAPARLTVAGAVHGTGIARVDEPRGLVEGADGLATARTGIPLLATFADCFPIVVFDPRRRAVVLAHAGWRGAAAGMARKAVETLEQEYGSSPSELVAGIGPGICGGCYEVGEEVAARFPADLLIRDGDRARLDLAGAIAAQLLEAGLPAARIHQLGLCTKETPDLPSHRRSPDGTRFACIVALTAGGAGG